MEARTLLERKVVLCHKKRWRSLRRRCDHLGPMLGHDINSLMDILNYSFQMRSCAGRYRYFQPMMCPRARSPWNGPKSRAQTFGKKKPKRATGQIEGDHNPSRVVRTVQNKIIYIL